MVGRDCRECSRHQLWPSRGTLCLQGHQKTGRSYHFNLILDVWTGKSMFFGGGSGGGDFTATLRTAQT